MLISVYHPSFLSDHQKALKIRPRLCTANGGFCGEGESFHSSFSVDKSDTNILAMAYLLSLGLMQNSIPICRLVSACVYVCASSGVGVLFGGIVSGFEEPILRIKTSLRFCQIIRALWH